jgi:ketosteroid isomerase-like protein
MNANDDIKALEALEDRRQAAMLAGDLDTLGEILHDELTYVHSTGGIDTKEIYIEGLRSGTFVYKQLTRDDQTIRVHGDTGMVFYHMVADVEIRGNMRRLDNRLLAVWARDGGEWRLIGLQSGAIPEPA